MVPMASYYGCLYQYYRAIPKTPTPCRNVTVDAFRSATTTRTAAQYLSYMFTYAKWCGVHRQNCGSVGAATHLRSRDQASFSLRLQPLLVQRILRERLTHQ
ncbi:unnamed protein product, partial [Rangifer tarandus platyrhynchus]